MQQLASNCNLDTAYNWLCQQRKNYSHNADVWDLRFNWETLKPKIQATLLGGEYRFSPLTELRLENEKRFLWCAQDALVLRALTQTLTPYLKPNLSKRCTHLLGNGGTKQALRAVAKHLPKAKFALRSDAFSYYASIDHFILYEMLSEKIKDQNILRLLWQYLKITITYGGNYWEVNRGISLGCPLSPLMAAVYMDPLDKAMEKLDVFYVRYMDDWVILAKTRWQHRKAIKVMNQVLNQLKLKKHPDKTSIGPVERGFDFLGYRISLRGLKPAKDTLTRFHAKVTQLYEQGASVKRIEDYQRRWWGWLMGGLSDEKWDIAPLPGGKSAITLINTVQAWLIDHTPSQEYCGQVLTSHSVFSPAN